MIVLAFLQNMWVKNPASVQQILDRHKDEPMFWNEWTKRLLFNGCKTGRVLKQVFGDECLNWIYDECTKEIADNPKTILKADHKHIQESLIRISPNIIITFGGIASKAVEYVTGLSAFTYMKILNAPHPAARQPDTIQKLKDFQQLITQISSS